MLLKSALLDQASYPSNSRDALRKSGKACDLRNSLRPRTGNLNLQRFSPQRFAQIWLFPTQALANVPELDLKKLKARAFDRPEWAEDVRRRYHFGRKWSADRTGVKKIRRPPLVMER